MKCFRYCLQIISIIINVLLNTNSLFAGSTETSGTFAGNILKLDIDIRSISMGCAFSGIYTDISGSYYHPAGLVVLDVPELNVVKKLYVNTEHTEWLAGIRYEYLGFSSKISRLGRMAINTIYLYSGDIEQTDVSGNVIGKFSMNSFITSLSWASRFNKHILFGVNTKFLQEQYSQNSSLGLGIDLDFMLCLSNYKNFVNVTVRNIGIVGYKSLGSVAMPIEMRISYVSHIPKFGYGKLFITSELVTSVESSLSLSLGLEYVFRDTLALRMGYKYKLTGYDTNLQFPGISFGIAAYLSQNLYLSYAFIPYGWLGDTHRIGISIRF